jgi:hypothetical protein
MRMANKAIEQEHHPTPMIDSLIHTLNGGIVFSKLNLLSGYHQFTLASEFRSITTFATHKGLRRHKRLNLGTNSASEIFQKMIQDQICDIPGSLNISDDVVVFGKTQREHDDALRALYSISSQKSTSHLANRNVSEISHPLLSSDLYFQQRESRRIQQRLMPSKMPNCQQPSVEYAAFWAWPRTVPNLSQILVNQMFPNHFAISPGRMQHSNGMTHKGIPSTTSKTCCLTPSHGLFQPSQTDQADNRCLTSWFVSNPPAEESREG